MLSLLFAAVLVLWMVADYLFLRPRPFRFLAALITATVLFSVAIILL